MGVFLYSEAPKWDPAKKMEKEIEQRQIKPDLEITHQG